MQAYKEHEAADDASGDGADGRRRVSEEEVVVGVLRAVAEERSASGLSVLGSEDVWTFGADDAEETSRHFAAKRKLKLVDEMSQLKKTQQRIDHPRHLVS